MVTVTYSVSLAQHRVLRRLLRGERLPLKRFTNVTTQSLARKGLIGAGTIAVPGKLARVWFITALGKKVCATRKGVLRLELENA